MKKLMLLLCLAQAAFGAITLTVTGGNGQLVPSNEGISTLPSNGGRLIVINVLNSGAPVVGATVTIACTIGGSSTPAPLNTTTPVTDASGNATVVFIPGIQTSGQYVMQYVCTGTYSAVTASFIETGYYVSPTLIEGIYFYRLLPSSAALSPYTATAGTAGTPVKVQVFRSDTIAPVANVAVRLIPQPDGTAGTQQAISVAEGTGTENSVLTDANGYATLTPTFTYPQTAQSSSYETFKIDIGAFHAYGPFQTNILAASSSVLPGTPPAIAPNPGVGGHVWWRLYVTHTQEYLGANDTEIAELQFFDAAGGQISTTGCTASNLTQAFSNTGANLAFDGNEATYYRSDYPPYATQYPQWIACAFPSAVNVASFFLVGNGLNHLTNFKLQYSDNGTGWSDATAAIVETNWIPGTTTAHEGWGFAVASPPAGQYLSYRLNATANGGSTAHLSITELGLYATLGGTNLAIAEAAHSVSSTEDVSHPHTNAFDGNTSTGWWTVNTVLAGWISLNFKTPQAVTFATITPMSGDLTAAPTAFKIQGSNDGGQTWADLATCSMTWSSTTPQTCNVATVASPPPTSISGGNPPTASARGNIDYDQIALDARHGDGTKLQTSDATGVFGHCPMYGTYGALTDSGVVCGGAAPPVTNVALSVTASEFTVTSGALTAGGMQTIVLSDAPLLTKIQQQYYTYATDTGTANAYAVALTPAPTLVLGSVVVFKAVNANTGASTLAVNGGSAIAIKKNATAALVSGDIAAGQIVTVIYDGTNFQMTGGTQNSPIALLTQNSWNDTVSSNVYGGGGTHPTTTVGGGGGVWITSPSPQNIIVDMVTAQTFNALQIMPNQSNAVGTAYSLDVSDDGSTWTSTGETISGFPATVTLQSWGLAAAYTHRYFRVNVTADNGFVSMATLKPGLVGYGTVTSVGATFPSWLAVSGSPVTTAGTVAVTAAAAQTSHQVIGTCGTATSFAPCALVAGDLPSTAVTPGSYTNTNITVDAQGRITAAANGARMNTVAFSATPAFDLSLGGVQSITLTGNVTSSTITNQAAGQMYSFLISQDATGSRTFVWPTNVKGATTIGSTLSKTNVQTFISDGTNLYAIGAGVINQ